MMKLGNLYNVGFFIRHSNSFKKFCVFFLMVKISAMLDNVCFNLVLQQLKSCIAALQDNLSEVSYTEK